MFKNYIKVAFRNLFRQKIYSLINILGLSIGMALCIAIVLFVRDELSYDQYHKNADRMYRVVAIEEFNNRLSHYKRIGPGVTARLHADYPDIVEQMTRLLPAGEVWTKFGEKLFHEERVFLAENSFFDMFTFDFIRGDRQTALAEPNSLVLNSSTAQRYFGTSDALGKMVSVDMPGAPVLKITAVVADAPGNSHFHPDMLVSLSTVLNEQNAAFFENLTGNAVWGYLLLKENCDPGAFEAQLGFFLDKYLSEAEREIIHELYLQPITDIHLHSTRDPWTEIEPENLGNISYIYIFSAIALCVLLIACFNFMNLATARSINRAREVGLRKVVGAQRRQLLIQFLGESILIAFISLPIAVLLLYVLLPLLNNLTGKALTLAALADPILIAALFGIFVAVGLISGSYPAIFLSAFRPIAVLKSKLSPTGSSALVRKILVVGQFTVSILFLVALIVIFQQMHFMLNSDLGYEKENAIVVPTLLPVPPDLRARSMEVVKDEFLRHPDIIGVSAASAAPGDIRGLVPTRLESTPEEEAAFITQVAVDFDYLTTLHIKIDGGRNFSEEFGTDVNESYIVNEEMLDELGIESPLGTRLVVNGQLGSIIGTFSGMHWEPKRRIIAPMIFYVQPLACTQLIVKVKDGANLSAALDFMEQKWDETISSRPFQYHFLDEMVGNLYKTETRLSDVVFFFTLLTIFVSCLGLFGLASFTTEQRTKEIGVRKVLGASSAGIVLQLTGQFGKLILLANCIAWPLAYLATQRWLQTFYYRIPVKAENFVAAALLVAAVAFFAVSYQSVKAAMANPAVSLRDE